MSDWKDKELEKDWEKTRFIITCAASIINGVLFGVVCGTTKLWVLFVCGAISTTVWMFAIIMLFENYQCRRAVDAD